MWWLLRSFQTSFASDIPNGPRRSFPVWPFRAETLRSTPEPQEVLLVSNTGCIARGREYFRGPFVTERVLRHILRVCLPNSARKASIGTGKRMSAAVPAQLPHSKIADRPTASCTTLAPTDRMLVGGVLYLALYRCVASKPKLLFAPDTTERSPASTRATSGKCDCIDAGRLSRPGELKVKARRKRPGRGPSSTCPWPPSARRDA